MIGKNNDGSERHHIDPRRKSLQSRINDQVAAKQRDSVEHASQQDKDLPSEILYEPIVSEN
jgi:hypothetical protein